MDSLWEFVLTRQALLSFSFWLVHSLFCCCYITWVVQLIFYLFIRFCRVSISSYHQRHLVVLLISFGVQHPMTRQKNVWKVGLLMLYSHFSCCMEEKGVVRQILQGKKPRDKSAQTSGTKHLPSKCRPIFFFPPWCLTALFIIITFLCKWIKEVSIRH